LLEAIDEPFGHIALAVCCPVECSLPARDPRTASVSCVTSALRTYASVREKRGQIPARSSGESDSRFPDDPRGFAAWLQLRASSARRQGCWCRTVVIARDSDEPRYVLVDAAGSGREKSVRLWGRPWGSGPRRLAGLGHGLILCLALLGDATFTGAKSSQGSRSGRHKGVDGHRVR
jgi:hypothetical protein